MTTYTIENYAGSVVGTIAMATTSGATWPVEIPGQGITLYGPIIGQNLYWLMENFAKATAPVGAVEGMDWYKSSTKRPYFYNGTRWIPYLTGDSALSFLFTMEAAATNLDFKSTSSTAIFVSPNDGGKWIPTGILLRPSTISSTITGDATFSLRTLVTEDVMESQIISNGSVSTTKHIYYSIEGMTEPVVGTNSLFLDITQAATGSGNVRYTVQVYGTVVY